MLLCTCVGMCCVHGCGVVWRGVVWCGVVYCDVAECGVVWRWAGVSFSSNDVAPILYWASCGHRKCIYMMSAPPKLGVGLQVCIRIWDRMYIQLQCGQLLVHLPW